MTDLEKKLNIKVLMYHRVLQEEPEKDTRWHYVTVSTFRKQMEMIDKLGYTTVTFQDYKLYMEEKLTLPAKSIIITFDDGYLDTYENAIPILREMDMSAVIFVMGNRTLERANWDERDENDICPLMTDSQLREAREMGFEIGAHSLDHYNLLELSNQEISHQLEKSKEQIESILEDPIHTFAYPYGSVDYRVRQVVAESDFSFACGVYTGSPRFGETVFDFRRLAVNQFTNLLSFALMLLLPYQYVEWMYHRAKSREKTSIHYKNMLTKGKDGLKGSLEKRKNGTDKNRNAVYHGISDSESL